MALTKANLFGYTRNYVDFCSIGDGGLLYLSRAVWKKLEIMELRIDFIKQGQIKSAMKDVST